MDTTTSPCVYDPTIKNINDYFPEELLRIVFLYLLYEDLLKYRAVCSHWKALIEQIFAPKTSLQLHEAFSKYATRQIVLSPMPCMADNEMHLNLHKMHQLSAETATLFASLLSNVTHFTFCYASDFSQIDITLLMEKMPQLTDVTLYRLPVSKPFQKRLFQTLNSLQSLRELYLFNMHECILPDDLTVLNKLECFQLDHYYKDLASVLKQFGPNLYRLKLVSINLLDSDLSDIPSIAPQIQNSLTHLSVQCPRLHSNQYKISTRLIRSIAEHFPNLQFLCVKSLFDACKDTELSFEIIFPILAQLKHLTELQLPHLNFYTFESQRLRSLPRFDSLQKLHLRIEVCNQEFAQGLHAAMDTFAQAIAAMLPSLVQLIIETECIDLRLYRDAFVHHLQKCAKLHEFSFILTGHLNERGVFGRQTETYRLRD